MKASLILGILMSQLSLVKGECLPQVDLGYEIHEALKYNVRPSHLFLQQRSSPTNFS